MQHSDDWHLFFLFQHLVLPRRYHNKTAKTFIKTFIFIYFYIQHLSIFLFICYRTMFLRIDISIFLILLFYTFLSLYLFLSLLLVLLHLIWFLIFNFRQFYIYLILKQLLFRNTMSIKIILTLKFVSIFMAELYRVRFWCYTNPSLLFFKWMFITLFWFTLRVIFTICEYLLIFVFFYIYFCDLLLMYIVLLLTILWSIFVIEIRQKLCFLLILYS